MPHGHSMRSRTLASQRMLKRRGLRPTANLEYCWLCLAPVTPQYSAQDIKFPDHIVSLVRQPTDH
jgi:hypothetical protein